ncbi:MAG: lectin [SAR86 cluster bacterium]|uniref:Lectin n=1 Tax=SAR86 cluster bacterium TaxID=2030880 RepID=A0A2A5CFN5_9GAMM|nr:MAG: lectin [SAR86 cluster bacterium]
MNKRSLIFAAFALTGIIASAATVAQPPSGEPNFFLTATGSGNGGDLGGLAGADAICQSQADAAGLDGTFRAYLSTQGSNAVNARDRIGEGPWFNVQGARVAANVEELHSLNHRVGASSALTATGNRIPGSGFSPNRHDVLTGSQADGTAYPPGEDMTCNNWTSSSEDGTARVGHHDWPNWNSAHNSQGCTQQNLINTGGDGLFFCFAQ